MDAKSDELVVTDSMVVNEPCLKCGASPGQRCYDDVFGYMPCSLHPVRIESARSKLKVQDGRGEEVPIDGRWEDLPPLDVTQEDEEQAFKIPIDFHPKDPGNIGSWWVQLMTWMGAARVCRERQLRETLSTLSATQRELECQQNGWIQCISDKSLVDFELSTTQREREELRDKCEHLKQQAIGNAQEMRTQKSIVREIYQLFTGATGEPGDWNGAEPARKVMAELSASQARVAELEKALKLYRERHIGCAIRTAGLVSGTKIDDRCKLCVDTDAVLAPK